MTHSPEHLSDVDYDSRARATLASVEATVDRLLQDDVIDIDASRTGGLLELGFPAGGTIVINTQPPLHELWLAAGAAAGLRAQGSKRSALPPSSLAQAESTAKNSPPSRPSIQCPPAALK